MTETTDDPFPWGDRGKQYWLELGSECKANPLQIKFACARHSGASQTAAAKLAGYQGDDTAMRGCGYKAARSNAVVNMLALANAEAPAVSKVMDRTTRVEHLSAIAHKSPDQTLKIRAIEALEKIDQQRDAQRANEQEPSLDQIAREMIEASPTFGYVYFCDAITTPKNEDGESISIVNLPYIKTLSPHLRADFPVSFQKFRAAIGEGWLVAQFDSWGAGPYVTPEQLLATLPAESKSASQQTT